MKKVMILLIAAMCVAFTGCDKDDEKKPIDGNLPIGEMRLSSAQFIGWRLAEFDYLSYTENKDGSRFYAMPDSIYIGEERAVILSVKPSGGAGWLVDKDKTRFYLAAGATLTFTARAEADSMYFTELTLNAYTYTWEGFHYTQAIAADWPEHGHLTLKPVREFSLTRTAKEEIGIDEIVVGYMISGNYKKPDDKQPGALSTAEFDFTVLPENPGDGTPVNGTAYTFPAGVHYPAGSTAVQLEITTDKGAPAARYIEQDQVYLDFPKGNTLKLRPCDGVELHRVKFDIEFSEEPNPDDFVITNAEPGDVGVLNVTDKTAEMSVKINNNASFQNIQVMKILVFYKNQDDPSGNLTTAEFDFTVLPENPGEGTPLDGGTAYTFPSGVHYPDGCDAVQLEITTDKGATAARYIENQQVYLDFPKGNTLKLRPCGGVRLNKVKFDIEFSGEPDLNDFVITNAEPGEGEGEGVLNLADKTAEMSIKINDAASMQSIKLKKIKVYYKDMSK